MVYRSPWTVQLKRLRPIQRLTTPLHPDIIIIGGGIAGVTTAYYVLRETSQTVLLLEADAVAHGATGHNAGQVVSYFERPLHDIAKTFGADLAVQAHEALIDTWSLFEEIITTAQIRTPLTQFKGYAGFSTEKQVLSQLQTLALLSEAHHPTDPLLIAQDSRIASTLPTAFRAFCTTVPHKDVLHVLDTTDTRFIAALPERKGCTNSSLFTEELVGFLLNTYPDRFHLAEATAAQQITPTASGVTVNTSDHTLTATHAVLCTNGYTTHRVHRAPSTNTASSPVVSGTIGFMNGYFENTIRTPAAIQYFTEQTQSHSDPYYYVTRRLYEHGRHAHTLLCVGGPERPLPPGHSYNKHARYSSEAHHHLHSFLHASYHDPPSQPKPDFQWHGLMGYTKTLVRLIGPEPHHPTILYNLGCNGVGILPAVYGGKHIAAYLAGKTVPLSIFTPSLQLTS
ncbi:MAG: FAD-binding oxidoreductase [Candidatus Thermoplasmatota archaeon]|nr:FAD-binding oxidoreductase [Candidatus Thermoplasmatota archaeon]